MAIGDRLGLHVRVVFSLQYTQNRDTRAIQLKLDEILRGELRARTQLVKLERLSDEELAQVERELLELRDQEEEEGERPTS